LQKKTKKYWKTEKCDSKFNSLVLLYTCITTTLDFRQDKTVCTAKMILGWFNIFWFFDDQYGIGGSKKKE